MADAFHALRGFLLMMTKQGRLLYISDNVADYLGHSVVSNLFFSKAPLSRPFPSGDK